MTIGNKIRKLFKSKKPLADIKSYFEGTYRYKLYYNKTWGWLIRTYIREQIDYRIKVMNKECYNRGSCIMCGCETTALQMASKRCDDICYPSLMNREEWERFKINGCYNEADGMWIRVITLSPNGNSSEDVFYKETQVGFIQHKKQKHDNESVHSEA